MSKQTIEEKDQELIQKFRSVIHLKQQQSQQYKKYGLSTGLVVCGIIGVILLGFLALNAKPPENIGNSDKVAINRPEGAAVTSPEKNAPDNAPPLKSPEEAAAPFAAESESLSVSTPPQPERTSAAPVQAAQTETGTPETESNTPSSAPEPAPSVEGIRIAEIVACKRVENRQYVAPQATFSLEKDGKPDVWIWMDVRSDKRRLPYTLKHVYYVDGRKYAAVPLEIGYPRMRTWSNITLERSDLVGQWQVAVVTERGETLSRVEFSVIP